MESLWGEEFEIKSTRTVAKKVKEKINNVKEPTVVTSRTIKSKSISLQDKLNMITTEVYRILGRYKEDTQLIKTKEDLITYIDKAISNGVIAIDTETNNSLDPITCKLMGGCIYTPGMKNAYIPINHVDKLGNRLEWQLTEQDINEEFSRLNNTTIIMHNGKFDYQVIKCTCNLPLHIDWDTMIGSRLLDENEKSAGLKQQYIAKIDSTVEKYSIDHLFEGIEYSVVDPEIFALYAATDSFMTYKLYEWQKQEFEQLGMEKLYNLFKTVEMPVVIVAAEMELDGICIDADYSKLLSDKYHNKLIDVDNRINSELLKYKDKISSWRETSDANFHPLSKKPNKDGLYTEQKSKSEQLEEPVNVSSPSQLAILLYDILDIGIIDKKTPRGTGEDVLKKIKLPICDLILERRGLLKLINTYIDKLPECVNIDGRLHAHFNQLGTDTGRFSSTDPNLQNIPSHEKSIRMMFVPSTNYNNKNVNNDIIELYSYEQVQLHSGEWINVSQLQLDNIVLCDNENNIQIPCKIINIENNNALYVITLQEI